MYMYKTCQTGCNSLYTFYYAIDIIHVCYANNVHLLHHDKLALARELQVQYRLAIVHQ